ncbi:YecA family protein [Bhargavaea ullalensis]
MIGRNDPCPCGSGKKYKKCHGRTEGGAQALADSELKRIMAAYIQNAPSRLDRTELSLHIKTWMTHLGGLMETEVIEGAGFEHFLFVVNRKMWESHLDAALAKTDREEVKTVLKAWREPFVLMAALDGKESGHFLMTDVFGGTARSMRADSGKDAPAGTVFFGIVLQDPREREDGVQPVTTLYSIPPESAWVTGRIRKMAEAEGAAPDAAFLARRLLDVFRLLFSPQKPDSEPAAHEEQDAVPEAADEAVLETAATEAADRKAGEGTMPTDGLTAGQANAVSILSESLRADKEPLETFTKISDLLVRYFIEENPIVRKPGGFVAGAYLAAQEANLLKGEAFTAKEAAERFGVSSGTAQKYAAALSGRLAQ